METKKYVRIKKAKSSDLAYSVYIGRVFTVIGENENEYILHSVNVLKEDAEVIVTEKRLAAVGDRVLITATGDPQAYENGKEYEVRQINSNGVSVIGPSLVLFHNEYEVIVNNEVKNEEADEVKKTYAFRTNLDAMGYDELIEHGEDVIRAIRLRAYGEGRRQGKLDAEMDATYGQKLPVSAQARRDEIVEQAKGDVEELMNKGGDCFYVDGEYQRLCNVEFVVNRNKRAVVALLKGAATDAVWTKGIAKAAPSDCFNVHIGKAIALRRALGLAVPDEYLNAPQPTEVRVGDVIRYENRVSTVVPLGSDADTPTETYLTTAKLYPNKIIDDSREEVGGE
ncbi:hypothetical protein [Bacillus atrophaeus]|uniref:hypothetical protein n=1 Tax=Bacillus atrophaeus TaxID=1452 RepID=UPI0015E68841|nr:hypothetical protein [Bacillus atrophaeus]